MLSNKLTQYQELAADALKIIRNEGILAVFAAFLRFVNLNPEGYVYNLRFVVMTRLNPFQESTDPYRVIWVNPNRIRRSSSREIHRWNDLGKVISGNWDQKAVPLSNLVKYQSVFNHFKNGTPWEYTDLYQEAIDRIESGETYWNGCKSENDIRQRTIMTEELYKTIQNEGYLSQEELHGRPLDELVPNRKFDRSKEEIAVAIGRDGELLFVDGNHRLAISHVIDIDKISVHVVARHQLWERVRRRIQNADNICELDMESRSHLSHPDIKYLHEFSRNTNRDQ